MSVNDRLIPTTIVEALDRRARERGVRILEAKISMKGIDEAKSLLNT